MSDGPALVTVPGIELIEVGIEWETRTGVFTFTAEDLQSAIASQLDPAVRTPVLKLGHSDPRFDGQPSFGRLANLRLSEDGLTLIGDYIAVPVWLKDAMPSAYPRRSIEGWFNYSTKAGNSHPFVLTAVALLGEAYPAITTLADIEAVFGAEAIDSIEMVAASSPSEGELVVATKVEDDMPKYKTKVAASASTSDVQRAFYDSDQGDSWDIWIREFYVDPNELIISDERDGKTYSVTYTINGDDVEFADRVEVRVVYQPVTQVAASAARIPAVVFATKEESRPGNFQSESQVNNPEDKLTPDQLKVLNLPEDATEEQITARLAELTKAETPDPQGDEPDDGTHQASAGSGC